MIRIVTRVSVATSRMNYASLHLGASRLRWSSPSSMISTEISSPYEHNRAVGSLAACYWTTIAIIFINIVMVVGGSYTTA